MTALEIACRALIAVVFGSAAATRSGRPAFADFWRTLPDLGVSGALAATPVASAIVAAEASVAGLALAAPPRASVLSARSRR
ncbi:MAG TPA: MauE/DoxX family redox-associated membrane protein [Kofleriaceae bacterium]|nr:MauE/DoxX family redox-associated membrane protein [Kofleriaceae bacterium]